MNKYIRDLKICIDDKLMKHSMNTGESIIYLHIMYNHNVTEICTQYDRPYEHYSKILVQSLNNTIGVDKYGKRKE